MTLYRPELLAGETVPMAVTNPRHLVPLRGSFSVGGKTAGGQGAVIAELGKMIGSEAATRSGSFDDAMLRALDAVSGAHQFAGALEEKAITEPGSVDPQDVTIAQAKAEMALSIARTVLNRVVQGWRDLINTR